MALKEKIEESEGSISRLMDSSPRMAGVMGDTTSMGMA